jgi:hypothetical protein
MPSATAIASKGVSARTPADANKHAANTSNCMATQKAKAGTKRQHKGIERWPKCNKYGANEIDNGMFFVCLFILTRPPILVQLCE